MNECEEFYAQLQNIAQRESISLNSRFRHLRELLEHLVRSGIDAGTLQTTDLAARINYLCAKASLDGYSRSQLQHLRIRLSAILNHGEQGTENLLFEGLAILASVSALLWKQSIPEDLHPYLDFLPKESKEIERVSFIKRLRVVFIKADESFLYVYPENDSNSEFIRVRYGVQQVNDVFEQTVSSLWPCVPLNLLDVSVDAAGIYTPGLIVLEPDYLIDISSLAECYKDYGSSPYNYFFNRLTPSCNTRYVLLGNIANLFLDEWVHAGNNGVDFNTCMQKAFQLYPVELTTCVDLYDPEQEKQFFSACRTHFNHIRETVLHTFNLTGYELDKSDAVLEPTYLCEALGLQGRLDYVQRDLTSFIEMKSGKADEYTVSGKVVPKENNRVQMLLYMAVLEFNMGMHHQHTHPYLLYTRYPLLYPAVSNWMQVKRIINLRNRIVAMEHALQQQNSIPYTANLLQSITPQQLNERQLSGTFWNLYLAPQIQQFADGLQQLDALEQAYFYATYNFIVKELYTSKSGDTENGTHRGASSLWLSTLDEKKEGGDILYGLTMVTNQASLSDSPTIVLNLPNSDELFLPNFREGDAIVLYECNDASDTVTNRVVFKGNIESLTNETVCVRLRATQQNDRLFPLHSCYAIEHDVMDTTFRSMFHGLSTFMQANQDRRDLLLARKLPTFDSSLWQQSMTEEDDFRRIALKALAAKDYFLLIGPPGTGKTSCALRTMVEMFLSRAHSRLLLLSYTNRAVDEICYSIDRISPSINYIRIGSSLSCASTFQNRLLKHQLAGCRNRNEVRQHLLLANVIVGTVAALSTQTDLFNLLQFDAAIVDEATQILEPQLLQLLCARTPQGQNAIGKFILIGDHKQLPAVVLQDSRYSLVTHSELCSIGVQNFKDSLFERLHRYLRLQGNLSAIDMLCRQGRMHPAVAAFSNEFFYEGKLLPVGLPHQLVEQSKAVYFMPSKIDYSSVSGKVNRFEACMAAKLVKQVWLADSEGFDPTRTLGIITPYRSQIALIRQELFRLQVPCAASITIDTVERYQGSERDVIIYSFCVNYRYQLKTLPNLMEENGKIIDRKLNVVLTRARKQLYILGVRSILSDNPIYKALIKSAE